MKRTKPFIFNPAEESKESLIANFVIRTDVFQKIINGIKHSDPEVAPQHYLIVGQRGMGKTTLLLRLQYEVENTPALATQLMPMRFSEEQYNISNLINLWEETAIVLSNKSPEWKDLYHIMLAHEKEEDYEEVCFRLLEQYVKKTGKRILFLIDNVGKLFDRFTDRENRRLREILMTSPYILLVGGSAEMLEHTHSYDKPFFEFFYQFKLEPLAKKDTLKLMKTLASRYDVANKIAGIIKNAPQRIEALRRITGGVPRTMVLLFEILADSDNGAAFEDLETLTDRVTALYGQRMESLKPQQQKIIDALARAWEPLTAAEILQQSRLYREELQTNQLSSQLGQMEDNQLVETVPGRGRTKRYRIRERFFNIWYLMRYGRQEVKQQVLWLVRFLETWCTMEELQDVAHRQIDCLSNGAYYSKAAYYKAVVMHEIEGINTGTKKKLLRTTEDYLRKQNEHDWANNVHALYETMPELTFTTKAGKALEENNMAEAEHYLLIALENEEPEIFFNIGYFYHEFKKDYEKAENFYLDAIKNSDSNALNNLGGIYHEKGEFTKAEKYYLKAANKSVVEALANLGELYHKKGEFEKAEEFYLKAVGMGDIDTLNDLGRLYHEKGETDKAEEFYLKAANKNVVEALSNLGELYHEKGEFEKAEEFYLKAVGMGDIHTLNDLGTLYHEEGKVAKAEEFYLKAVEKGDSYALFNLGNLHSEKGKVDKAEGFYLRAVSKGSVDAMFNLANLYRKNGETAKAEEYYLKAIDRGDIDSMISLGILYGEKEQFDKAEDLFFKAVDNGYFDALTNLATLYHTNGKIDKAEEFYFKAIEKGDVNALANLGTLYKEKGKIDKATEFYLMAINKGSVAALFNLAFLYDEKGEIDNAEKYYLKASNEGDINSLVNLGMLYAEKRKFAEAESTFLMAIDKGDIGTLYYLASLYKSQGELKKAEERYLQLRELDAENLDALRGLTTLYFSIGESIQALKYAEMFFHQKTLYTDMKNLVYMSLTLLLYAQYNFLLNKFNQEDGLLKQHIRPFYYALAYFIKDQMPGEYEKTSPEIAETVEEIIKKVMEQRNENNQQLTEQSTYAEKV